MSAVRFWYAFGYMTREAAEEALEDCFATGEISEGEHPIVRSYGIGRARYWGIEIDG